jgi:Predicted periplasmic lipoprotein (DUF2279)
MLFSVCLNGQTTASSLTEKEVPDFNLPILKHFSSDTIKKTEIIEVKSSKRQKLVPYAIVGSSIVGFSGVYLYLKQAWWKDNGQTFHFDRGRDWKYASGLDKMAHFTGGLIVSDAYFDACKGLKLSEKQAAWWGFGVGTFVQVLIEYKDGFSANYGFSYGDILAGSIGALQPLLRQKSAFFRNTDFKFSYWQRSARYFEHRGLKITPFHTDDYLNQTYWMSTSLRYLTGNRYEKIPDWLNLALGWGNEAESWDTNPNNPGTGAKPEFYLALDVNLLKLIKPKRKFWIQTLKRINYLKFPMPTLQLTQKPKLWGVYF